MSYECQDVSSAFSGIPISLILSHSVKLKFSGAVARRYSIAALPKSMTEAVL
jgi:hypothetical protein